VPWTPEPEVRRSHPLQGEEDVMKGPLLKEVGQTFYLMGLMAAMVCFYVGVGLLAVRVLG